ncbi:TPA: 50S ribosomal protein L3 [Candidatus Micrarchaeota archaeon]|nr:50S ribosomal protein L3P [uncultured archaeon]HIH19718.1 50S ribosomal protein L3 [Candidatus Micrarchaeota archaeon]
MGKRGPRRGSRSFWHRARASRITPRVRSWPLALSGALGFPAFKAGMTQALVVDDTPSPYKGQEVLWPVTILEVPPIFVYAVTLWEKTPYGLKALAQVNSKAHPKQLSRSLTPTKKEKSLADELTKFEGRVAQARLLCCTQPWRIGLKKTPDVFEIALGGSVEEQLNSASNFIGKELNAKDVFAEGESVDAVAVTTGKGWQGVVKRYGVALNIRKATKSRRHGGSIGPERQAKVMYTVPRAGQTGFHKRTERAKRIVKISDDAKILPVFSHYGIVKGSFVAVKGSIPGPVKRFIMLRKELVPGVKVKAVEVKQLSV